MPDVLLAPPGQWQVYLGLIIPGGVRRERMVSSQGNELVELYDSLSIMYDAVPARAASEWKLH
jgi:hypothetical protein